MNDQQKNGSARHEQILRAAEKVFDRNGYATTTVDSVAEEAGISKGSIYNYFKSKEDLFHQVFQTAVAAIEAGIVEQIDQEKSAIAKMNTLVDSFFQRIVYMQQIGRLVIEFWAAAARDKQGELGATFEQLRTRHVELIKKIIDQGIAAGEFRLRYSPDLAASLILCVLSGVKFEMVLDAGIEITPAFIAATKRGVLAGLTIGMNIQQEQSEQQK